MNLIQLKQGHVKRAAALVYILIFNFFTPIITLASTSQKSLSEIEFLEILSYIEANIDKISPKELEALQTLLEQHPTFRINKKTKINDQPNLPTKPAQQPNSNTTLGDTALTDLKSGQRNVAIGYDSGNSLKTGSDNIYIGSNQNDIFESSTTRIGNQGTQKSCYIAGITNASASGNVVLASSNGKIGTNGTATIPQALNVYGRTHLHGSDLTINGSIRSSDLYNRSVTGKSVMIDASGLIGSGIVVGGDGGSINTLDDLVAHETLTVNGSTSLLNNISISGSTTIQGKASIAGSTIITNAVTITGSVALAKNVYLPQTSSSTVGVILSNNNPVFHSYGTNNQFVGNLSGNFTTTGNNNVALGALSLQNTTSSNNTALGYRSLSANFDGYNNTGVGSNSLPRNTHGFENVGVGTNALFTNTIGFQNTAVGKDALYNNTSGYNNVALGISALQNNTTGYQNTGIGSASLTSNTTGYHNTGVGVYTLQYNTEGYRNTAHGSLSLTNNTTGYDNTAVGSSALRTNEDGFENTGVGIGALYTNSSGFQNTAVGSASLSMNSTGFHNVAVGAGALQRSTNAFQSTAVGTAALLNNTTGYQNTGVGAYVMQTTTSGYQNVGVGTAVLQTNTEGYQNTGVGTNALQVNTAGYQNTALGEAAMQNNTTGLQNTAIGAGALQLNTTGSNNTACGRVALLNNTTGNYNTAVGNLALLDNTTGSSNIAIGTSAMEGNTHGVRNIGIGINALNSNSTGNENIAIGSATLEHNTTGVRNIGIGYKSLSSGSVGNANVALGERSLCLAQGSNNIGIGAFGFGGDSLVTGSNNIIIGNTGSSTSNSTIYLGTNLTHTQCFIAGIRGQTVSGPAVLVNSSGKLGVATSSRHYKKDIVDLSEKVETLNNLHPVSFTYKDEAPGTQHFGLIAEEVAEVVPELVIANHNGQPETVAYHEFPALLIAGYQHQQQLIDRQQKAIDQLEKKSSAHEFNTALLSHLTRFNAVPFRSIDPTTAGNSALSSVEPERLTAQTPLLVVTTDAQELLTRAPGSSALALYEISSLHATNSSVFDSNLTVSGNVTIGGALNLTGATTLANLTTSNIASSTIASSGELNAYGASAIHNTFTVTGTTQVKALHATNSSVFDRNLTVSGKLILSSVSAGSGSTLGIDGSGNVITVTGGSSGPYVHATNTSSFDTNITVSGNIYLNDTTSPSSGTINFGTNGKRLMFYGNGNTFCGESSGNYTTSGSANTAYGWQSFQNITSGSDNTCFGWNALNAMTSAVNNTAFGNRTLQNCSTGGQNTAAGQAAMSENISGSSNCAFGQGALKNSTSGSHNVAIGRSTIGTTSPGDYNVGVGSSALNNSTGGHNIGIGHNGGLLLTSGGYNICIGNQGVAAESATIRLGNSTDHNKCYVAGIRGVTTGDTSRYPVIVDTNGQLGSATSLRMPNTTSFDSNITVSRNIYLADTTSSAIGSLNFGTGNKRLMFYGTANTFCGDASGNFSTTAKGCVGYGYQTLKSAASGDYNVAIGYNSLSALTSGNDNVAIGLDSGSSVNTGTHNIFIRNDGNDGDAGTIRLGNSSTHNKCFIAGIRGITTTNNDAIAALIDSNGQLGTVSSSRRYKDNIQDITDKTSGLASLRPVSFTYKQHASPKPSYGLIAEEVAEVYPELVIYKDNEPETVAYQNLPPLLLAGYQQQQKTIDTQQKTIQAHEDKISEQNDLLTSLLSRLKKLEGEIRHG